MVTIIGNDQHRRLAMTIVLDTGVTDFSDPVLVGPGMHELAGSPSPNGDSPSGNHLELPPVRMDGDTRSKAVIEEDDRQEILNTTTFPWRAICHLRITAASGETLFGTGWFAGPSLVITAGHCVFDHAHGGWAKTIVVESSISQVRSAKHAARAIRALKPWINGNGISNRAFDYGSVFLVRDQTGEWPGNSTGYFGLRALDAPSLRNTNVNIAGYPTDKPPGTLWWHADSVSQVKTSLLTYQIDTFEGQSGSPVWRHHQQDRQVLGIHIGTTGARNAAVRVTSDVVEIVKGWRRESQQE